MSEKAQPGDTVTISPISDRDFGKEFLVVECPEKHRGGTLDKESTIWVDHLYNQVAWHEDNVKLVKKAGTVEGTKNCRSVEESLTRQRDDNLRSIFG